MIGIKSTSNFYKVSSFRFEYLFFVISMADTVSKEELDPYYEQIRRLPVKCSTTIRFFERESGLITVYDSDAELLAQKFFRSNGVVKKWGSRNVIYINLSLNNFESVLREALLSWHYRYAL